MRKITILLGALAIVAVGCGGGGSNAATSNSSSQTSGSSNQPVSLSGTTNNKGTQTASGGSINVEMDDFFFSPTFIQGTPGQTLTLHLKNGGQNAHTFTSPSLNVDKTLQPGESADVQVTLPQTGATEFHCNFHQASGMQGAFFFNAGDPVAGAGAGGGNSSSSSTSNGGGYNYN